MSNSTSPDMIDPNHFVLLATQTLAYKQEDLDKLRASNKYVKFDLSEVDSSEALPMGAS